MATKKAPVKKVVAKVTAAQKLDSFGIDRICEMTADVIPQRTIAAEIGVSWATFVKWIEATPARSEQYAHARAAQADKLAEDVLSIADEVDVEAKYDGDAVRLDLSATAVARNRLRVDARKWLASKMAPKRYGDKIEVDQKTELTGTLDVTLSPDEAYLRMIGR